MILSDDEVIQRLNSPDNIVNLINTAESNGAVEVRHTDTGKRGTEIHEQIRKLIASTANQTDETQAEVASIFGVTQPFVSQVTRGLVDSRLNTDLAEIANKSVVVKEATAHDEALTNLVGLLGTVKQCIPAITSAKEASKIAVDMSRIVGQLKPKEEDSKARTLVVINMNGHQKKESQFETIDV